MGTNYDIRFHICSKCDRYNEIHLGKSSAGWVFALNLNGKRHYSNWVGMKQFLKQEEMNGGQIYDEYGGKMKVKDFIDLVESKQKEARYNEINMLIDGYWFYDGEFS